MESDKEQEESAIRPAKKGKKVRSYLKRRKIDECSD